MIDERCERTELLVTDCAHCRPADPDERKLVLMSVADKSTPGQRAKAAGRSRNQAKLFAADTEASDLEIVARFLPPGFVDLYSRVLEIEFGAHNLGSARPGNPHELVGVGRGSGPRLSTSKTETRHVTRTHTASSSKAVIRSERALWGRYRLDRKLKRIVTDLHNLLAEIDGSDGSRPVRRQCAGKCHQFGEPDWLYCARCGGPMQEVG
ncbi:hypothetical protein [Amycolatopsis tucumanensis]|uniref:Transposase n=1 Tax=Amycolatopsis tucumanensis TaxID=401106 RepID=A0ABP7IXC1_9PSEU|nr:hypothetical protein [Amycolatopsis tucumanensis]MCF6423349.1 hypothetical protein [Amycolatopsis tucumanensis]